MEQYTHTVVRVGIEAVRVITADDIGFSVAIDVHADPEPGSVKPWMIGYERYLHIEEAVEHAKELNLRRIRGAYLNKAAVDSYFSTLNLNTQEDSGD